MTFVKLRFVTLFCFLYVQASAGINKPSLNGLSAFGPPLEATAGKFKDCAAYFRGDSLILENALIKRVFLFNDGNLATFSILNKRTGLTWSSENVRPDFSLPGLPVKSAGATFITRIISETPQHSAHLQAEVVSSLGGLELKRVFRLFPQTPALACDYYLRGDASEWEKGLAANNNQKNFEKNRVVMDQLSPSGSNWKVRSVEFYDSTDRNNTLVQEYDRVPYRSEILLRGNVLLMQKLPSGEGFFWLKEAPVSNVQLNYPGYDFSVKLNDYKAVGLGMGPEDVSGQDWVRGYSIVTGVTEGGDEGAPIALRTYQQQVKPLLPRVDNMIMLNTWGDRGRDENINEKFILKELRLGSKLGITHLQLDDGWQRGKSGASVVPGGSLANIWRNANYWEIDSLKFPDGFRKIMNTAQAKGITISTWFNPAIDSSFKYWQKDASVMIEQYRNYGIHIWKIDGVVIADKQAEINFRKMLDRVVENTDGKAVFNLDVTAGIRFGYHYFYEYGNLFLENRYTDFGNYYPHSTLRNLWMLSKYIPPQRLQIEFLNKWRNKDKYASGDPFAPVNYSFDYLFALTMPAQPLAWMEARNLPEEAFATSILIEKYKDHWHEWHGGQIYPIGEEPSGVSWTGFQSVLKNPSEGYILVFREMNDRKHMKLKLGQLPEGNYAFELVAGDAGSFVATVGQEKLVTFVLPNERSFAFYRYAKVEN